MSQLLYKTRCPHCAEEGKDRKGDNLGVYDDGHSYCFSCGYTQLPNFKQKIKNKEKQTKERKELFLPEDLTQTLGPAAELWLQKYFDSKLDYPLCYWSASKSSLYFPLPKFTDAWIYRYMGDNEDHPKWVTYRIDDSFYYILNPKAKTLVLTEDLISAHKVSTLGSRVGHIPQHRIQTMPLFCANIGIHRLVQLKLLGYNNLIFWLDKDKYKESLEFAEEARKIGFNTSVISTEKDPKECTWEQIAHELHLSTQAFT